MDNNTRKQFSLAVANVLKAYFPELGTTAEINRADAIDILSDIWSDARRGEELKGAPDDHARPVTDRDKLLTSISNAIRYLSSAEVDVRKLAGPGTSMESWQIVGGLHESHRSLSHLRMMAAQAFREDGTTASPIWDGKPSRIQNIDPLCQTCGLPLAAYAGPALGERGLICQTPGCDLDAG